MALHSFALPAMQQQGARPSSSGYPALRMRWGSSNARSHAPVEPKQQNNAVAECVPTRGASRRVGEENFIVCIEFGCYEDT